MQFFSGEIIETLDGSKSIKHALLNDSYHSLSGAVEESEHIYINCGLKEIDNRHITIFEMGFGTGLNLLLTLEYALKQDISINYYTIELYPLQPKVIEQMGYNNFCSKDAYNLFIKAHNVDWNERVAITDKISITKLNCDITSLKQFPEGIDLIYFDAFSPDTQPKLWSEEIFALLYSNTTPKGILTTYSSKGDVKRALRGAGFFVKRLAGIGGKRHILRATKGDCDVCCFSKAYTQNYQHSLL